MFASLRISPTSFRRYSSFGAIFVSIAIVCVTAAFAVGRNADAVHFYSTAAPPLDFPGPGPGRHETVVEPDLSPVKPLEMAPKMVAAPSRSVAPTAEIPPVLSKPEVTSEAPPTSAIDEAKAAMTSCAKTFAGVTDYTCTFFKRERIDGKLTSIHSMLMKARTRPSSFYFKFVRPNPGREAIYVKGGFGGRAIVHDVGIGKLIAGTLKLDPRSAMAMEDNRHPITEAGLGHMIQQISTAWDKELSPGESKVVLHPSARVGGRTCVLIETVHPRKQPGFMFHMVKVYIDAEHNLPIRFEAYDWPRNGRPAELLEEYTYSDLKLNVGLTSGDFDPGSAKYSFGRF